MLLILREEIICLIILLFLIFYYTTNKVKDREMFFLRMSLFALMHTLFDFITVITVNNLNLVPNPLNRFFHICFYLSGILFAVGFYHYIIHLCAPYQYIRRLKYAGYIPLLLFTLLLLFLPMEYVEGRGTNYSFGPLAYVGYALFLLYCTVCVILLFASRHRLETRTQMALLPMILIMYIAVILQALVPELLMTGANVTLICISTFVALDNPDKDFMKQALWDFSTGLKNRNSYNKDLAQYTLGIKGRNANRRIGFLVADMNYLKLVNDNYGHAEGDRLIAGAATALQEHLRSAEQVYRLGGDEFVAVYLSPDDQKVMAEMEAVTRACEQNTSFSVPLSIAMGYASGSLMENADKIFQSADERMYENKIRIKAQNPKLSPNR